MRIGIKTLWLSVTAFWILASASTAAQKFVTQFEIPNDPADPTTYSYVTGRYLFKMRDLAQSQITVQLPLQVIESAIFDGLVETGKPGKNIEFDVKAARFDGYATGSPVLTYYADLDGKAGPLGFRCEIWFRFALPRRHIQDVFTQDLGSIAKCHGSPFFNFSSALGDIISTEIRKVLGKKTTGQDSQRNILNDWKVEDPELLFSVMEAHVQGLYCDAPWGKAICISLGWTPTSTIKDRADRLINTAKRPSGKMDAADKAEAARLANLFKNKAFRKPSTRIPGYSFPAKLKNINSASDPNSYDDRDSTIFNGLLCAAGELEGCTAVQKAQSTDGRFWRSPDWVGYTEDESFTGDQFFGAIAYLLATRDKKAFADYLQWIVSHQIPLPSAAIPFDYGYETCEPDPGLRCSLAGLEWSMLNYLARIHGLELVIPVRENDVRKRYGFNYNVQKFGALYTPRGYRLHLVAVWLFLLQREGISDHVLDEIAAILATREPGNPFFLYLYLKDDKAVLNAANARCVIDPGQIEFDEWSWERASTDVRGNNEPRWKFSERWDCSFMYRLLSQ
jgi:hypothetical protein